MHSSGDINKNRQRLASLFVERLMPAIAGLAPMAAIGQPSKLSHAKWDDLSTMLAANTPLKRGAITEYADG